ncbi:CocE/NonD family hydrolase [Peristeroidobacter soli]|uniref:CocE/NonD family hydrolase n=1 Tax=Peristeroidobacter soli TaxID=2497877 RepID=UPI00101BE374|nr:CocE/NonD family hydrolase [Peristeroidobacter soli]
MTGNFARTARVLWTVSLLSLSPVSLAAEPASDIVVEMNVMVPMRDGTRLSTDIYRPAKPGRYPVILFRDAYGNGSGSIASARKWTDHGYVYVSQDVRGRYDSEGSYYPYVYEINDGYDTQQWAGAQSWSSGKVGMIGESYRAAVQWLPAHLRAPSLTAIAPRVTPYNYYKDVVYSGGALLLASRLDWAFYMSGRTAQSGFDWDKMRLHLPLKTMDQAFGYNTQHWRDWIAHPSYDSYWKVFDVEARVNDIDVPSFNMGGWYDAFLRGTLASYTSMSKGAYSDRARRGQKLLVGPWNHFAGRPMNGAALDFGPDAQVDFNALERRWYDHWLKGEDNGVMQEAPVRIFVMGENRWRDEQEWPLARTRYTKYYLQSAGKANTASGDGQLVTKAPSGGGTNTYIYDPANPVPTKGGNLLPVSLGAGPAEQGEVSRRDDVLVFTTAPLTQDTEVTGNISVTLYAASSAPDTDFTAKLVDVHPDGKAYNLADGVIRARYRESLERPALIEPGKVYEYKIDLWATSNVFKKGHQIRVDLSSSNFPKYDRNPNTGHKFGEDAELRTATQTIHHSRQYPSHITLPVIPR